MNLLAAIDRVERPENPTVWEFTAPIGKICIDLSVQEPWEWPDELDMRLKAYPIFDWYCTDEMVGLYAIYLDDAPVGCYYRSGRKCDYEFHWITKGRAECLRNVILSYIAQEKPDLSIINGHMKTTDFRYLGFEDTVLKVKPE